MGSGYILVRRATLGRRFLFVGHLSLALSDDTLLLPTLEFCLLYVALVARCYLYYITREAGSTVAESLVVLYQVGTHQIRRRRRAARSLTSQGRAEPLCARIESANRDVSEGKADL